MKTITLTCARLFTPRGSFHAGEARGIKYATRCPLTGANVPGEICNKDCPGYQDGAPCAIDVILYRFPRLREFVKALAEKIVKRIP